MDKPNCKFYAQELPLDHGLNCHACPLAAACDADYEAGNKVDWKGEIPFDGSPLPSTQAVTRPLVARARVAEMFEPSEDGVNVTAAEWQPSELAQHITRQAMARR